MEKTICSKFCSFYKPDKAKDNQKCGSVAFLSKHLTRREITSAAAKASISCDFTTDQVIRDMACAHCDYLKDGCDFRQGLSSPPCGGYAIVEHLLKRAH